MRSDMRWLLLLTAIIGIVGCADALKATSLIFGRSNANKTTASTTTTTTSTTVTTIDADSLNDDEKKDDGEPTEEEATKPPLTGIPQIDYIWDPNLPRELNGYNLSTYPFLNSVPDSDDIDFKCDGLHDGFYASIKYSCQLYHHCVYGIRHDFLCANFTAFDQKSFICHFVSEVNCKASAKYWFRNDALYKATTTTSTTTTTIAPPSTTSQAPERRRPEARRPTRRRRPQHEYYYDDEDYDDDYVEERMNRRRKANRNRNRRPSEYDDEYDNPPRANYKDDEDDYSYEQRSSYRHRNRDDDFEYDRRSYRNRKRPNENKRHYDDDRRTDDIEERRPHSDNRKHPHDPAESGKRKFNDRRTSLNDDRKTYNNDEKNSYDDRRSLSEDDRGHLDDRRSTHDERRKMNDERRTTSVDDDRRSSVDEGRRNTHDKRRPNSDRSRPQYDDEYEDYPKKQNPREDDYDDRSYKRPLHDNKSEIVPKVRSSSAAASIFNRPRTPPKINRPVPTNERKKYEYVPQKSTDKSTVTTPIADDEIYDDYDYEAEKAQIDIKHKTADMKKSNPAPSSQRDQRPSTPLKQEKLPTNFNTDELEDVEFDVKEKVTSIKPQRSTLPKVEAMQHQHQHQQPQSQLQHQSQRPIKTQEYYEKPKEVTVKSNVRPALDFNKDEYIPDSDLADYPDEEIDDRSTKVEDVRQQPETIPTRTDFRSNVPVQEHQEMIKPLHQDDVQTKIPYSPPQSQQDLQFKTKFHRLSNVRTADDTFRKSNTEPEERDVYTILPKDTISMIREPSGFKPVSYNDEPHNFDLDTTVVTKTRPYVRVMKRPFLPSRGGSPYLPRGLKAVGAGFTTSDYTTESAQIHGTPKSAQAAAIGNVQLYGGHQLPISRTNNAPYGVGHQPQQMHPSSIANDLRTTTQQPQIESPRSPLDEIFNSENDYDVTLNDALNPTLKPLSHESPIGFSLNKYDRANPYARSDVSHAPSQYRSTAIPIRQAPQTMQQQHQHQQQPLPQPQPQQQNQQPQQRPPQQSQYYDDEYEY
ncbi:probable serine/threonine-protein kinase kinX isoform X2 [Contarinia nasturtii]|nr:probable serine/threonine-protein kinase kinX isoform X2 [Contarinia nasturtii]XP_031618605.1 probable serine/threonine-protein kinase kinX isoform X2 [Contarinia nasturtii]XP_031618606.1 probable serine/threonine-protein kinase kinX isoform X2 [Contarinia nasturtii]XP_031618607.1 probable serine/threonine-protein kinase kinX isoform X2 [Contarinia nasturtii]